MADQPPSSSAPVGRAEPTRPWWREELRLFAELLVLSAFTIAQPLLDVVGRSPDFFVYHRMPPHDVLPFVAAVALGPPLVLEAIGLATRAAGRRVRRVVHLLMLAALATALCFEVGKHVHAPTGVPLAVLGVAVGTALAVLVDRSTPVQRWVTYAVPAPLAFALLFVFTTPAGSLARAAGATNASAVAHVRPPVVVVFMDEYPLRALLDDTGHVDARLFPNFAELAGSSTFYTNATGVSGWTPYALPAMLRGVFPQKAVAPSYLLYPHNLFTLLAGSYQVNAFETITQLCPPTECVGSAPPDATGLEPVLRESAKVAAHIASPYRSRTDPTQQYAEQPEASAASAAKLSPTFRFKELGKNQPERFTSFLDALRRPSAKPALDFLHILLPHRPWVYLPSGDVYHQSPPLDRSNGLDRSSQAAPLALDKQRLLLQLAYTDRLVGRLVTQLKRSGLWDPSLFVLTADHGVGVTENAPTRTLRPGNESDLMWVPLFIKKPGQRAGAVDDRNYMHVDLLPTISDVLDVRIPWAVDGISAFGPARKTGEKFFYNTAGKRITVDGARAHPKALTGLASSVGRPDDGVDGLFELGPHADLVGRRVSSLPPGRGSDVAVHLDSGREVTFTPDSGKAPAMVWGRLPGSGPQQTLAVTVNGVVAAVVDSFQGASAARTFAAMVPERLLRAGTNQVGVYVLDSSHGAPRLHPTRVA